MSQRGIANIPEKDCVLGRLEESILLITLACGPAASADVIKSRLDESLGSRTLASVFTTLERLTEKGMVVSDIEVQANARKRGRPRRLFKVTEEGVQSAERSVSVMYRLAAQAGVGKVA